MKKRVIIHDKVLPRALCTRSAPALHPPQLLLICALRCLVGSDGHKTHLWRGSPIQLTARHKRHLPADTEIISRSTDIACTETATDEMYSPEFLNSLTSFDQKLQKHENLHFSLVKRQFSITNQIHNSQQYLTVLFDY